MTEAITISKTTEDEKEIWKSQIVMSNSIREKNDKPRRQIGYKRENE